MPLTTVLKRSLVLTLVIIAGLPLLSQTKDAKAPATKDAKAPAANAGKSKAKAVTQANLAQLMRGIFYPASNVIFAAQDKNPGEIKPAENASMAANPLESSYGGWQAVENAGLAIAEASRLLTVTPRTCSNGRPVPVSDPDWAKFVAGVRKVGLAAYEAAKSKDQDKIVDVAGDLTEACANCHNKYREVKDRCK